jgi:hypothetical protein
MLYTSKKYLLLLSCILQLALVSNSAVAADEYVSIQEYLNQLAEQQKPPQIYGELVKQSKASSFYFAGEPYQGPAVFLLFITPQKIPNLLFLR